MYTCIVVYCGKLGVNTALKEEGIHCCMPWQSHAAFRVNTSVEMYSLINVLPYSDQIELNV